MVTPGRRGRIAGLILVAIGCGRHSGISDEGVTTTRSALTSVAFTLPLFVGEHPTDVALAASSNLFLNDRAVVIEMASNDRGMVSNIGTAALSTVIGASSVVGTVLTAAQAFIRINASIGGSFYQGSTTPPASQGSFFVSGVTKTGVGFTPDASWTRFVNWPDTFQPAPNLEPGTIPPVHQLPHGAYHTLDVKTGQTLLLNPGEYFLDGLIVEPGAWLDIQAGTAPVIVYIREGGLTFRGNFAPGRNSPGMAVPSLTVMTAGSVDLEQPFTGVVIAPNGYINLKANVNTNDPKTHRGAYFAKTVTIFEGNRLLHYRDPFSFLGFAPGGGLPLIGERTSVTGGSHRLPVADPTDEGHQSETVTAISRISHPGASSTYVVTVGYNDQTVSLTNPSLVYRDPALPPPTPPVPDARDGEYRLVKKGTSEMGWSYSLDDGRTFTYGGRVSPPTGWSIIWGDPAMAKSGIDDNFVYYAQLAGTTAQFEAFWNASKGGIESTGQNVANALNGFCIARSSDAGITFGSIACTDSGFQDGCTLAVAVDENRREQVYVAGHKARILRMDGIAMTYAPTNTIPTPFTLTSPEVTQGHPRMRVSNGILYYAQRVFTRDGDVVMVNRLNATTNATTWLGQHTVMCGNNTPCHVSEAAVSLGSPGFLELGPAFAFDIGPDANGQAKFRMIFATPDGTNGRRLNVAECDTDVTNCRLTNWSTGGEIGDEVNPSLRVGGGFLGPQWVATWRKIEPASPNNTMRHVAGNLTVVGGVESLQQRTLYSPGVPCPYDHPPSNRRLGEYDLIDAFADGRFFAAYSAGGPGCRWQGKWTSDSHVWGSTFAF